MYHQSEWRDARSLLLLIQGMTGVLLVVALGVLAMAMASEMADLLCVSLPRVRRRLAAELRAIAATLVTFTPAAYLSMVAYAAPRPARVEVIRRHLRTVGQSTTVTRIANLTRAAMRRQDRRMPKRAAGAHRAHGDNSILRAFDLPGVRAAANAAVRPHSHRRVTA
jgi:hypothetical protein